MTKLDLSQDRRNAAADSMASATAASSPAPCAESSLAQFPEKSATDVGIALLLLVTTCLYLRLFCRYTNLWNDEAVTLQGAQRILNGQVLYRDFFAFYTPGSYYWMALLFKIFGSSLFVARAALMIFGGFFSAFTYLVARRVCGRLIAAAAILPTSLVCLPYQFFALHNWDSTLSVCIALYCAVRFLETPRREWLLGIGLFTSATLLCEQSKGIGFMLGLILAFCILKAASRRGAETPGGNLMALCLGFCGPLLLTVAYFYSNHGLAQMIACMVWPLHHYPHSNRLPYGFIQGNWPALFQGSFAFRALGLFVLSPFFVISALPIFAVCFLVYSSFCLRRNQGLQTRMKHQVLLSAVMCGLLFSIFSTRRPDSVHIMYLGPLYSIVLAWMAEAAQSLFLRRVRIVALSWVLAAFAGLGLALALGPLAARHTLETRRGTLRASASYHLFDYVQSRMAAGERTLVYPYQPIYYYLTGTFSVSRYDWIMPDMYGRAEYQEMAQELASSRPRAVLLDPIFNDVIGPRWPEISLSALAWRNPVEVYIYSHYRPCRTFVAPSMDWHMVFMARNDLSCSLDPLLAQESR